MNQDPASVERLGALRVATEFFTCTVMATHMCGCALCVELSLEPSSARNLNGSAGGAESPTLRVE